MLKFDNEGTLIKEKVKYKVKHDNLTSDLIKEMKQESQDIKEKETRTFWCLKHNCFHSYITKKNQINKTHQKCLLSFDFYKFKEHMSNTEIFRLQFKKNWNQEKVEYYK